jgi:ParB family chromosome partitioning protein
MARKRAQLSEESARATLDAGGILDRIGQAGPRGLPIMELREVLLTQLHPNPFQPRRSFPPDSLEELAVSIRRHGFYGHLLVREMARPLVSTRPGQALRGVGMDYEIAYGERRLRAAKLADLETIPVQVRDLSDRDMLEIALTENVLREDLHPIEEAHGYRRLQDEMGYSVRQIGERIGKSKSYVATLLTLLRYPDIEQAMYTGNLPVRTAEELAKIADKDERRYFTAQVKAGLLDREGLIAERQRRAASAATAGSPPDPTVRSADTEPVAPAITLRRAARLLERLHRRPLPADGHAETVRLLRQIIDQARRLLDALEPSA